MFSPALHCQSVARIPCRTYHAQRIVRGVGRALADGDSLANITKPSKSATKRQGERRTREKFSPPTLCFDCYFAASAEHLQKVAKELVGLGPRQLQAVSPVLDAEPDLHEAISIAKGINRTNQVSLHLFGVTPPGRFCCRKVSCTFA